MDLCTNIHVHPLSPNLSRCVPLPPGYRAEAKEKASAAKEQAQARKAAAAASAEKAPPPSEPAEPMDEA